MTVSLPGSNMARFSADIVTFLLLSSMKSIFETNSGNFFGSVVHGIIHPYSYIPGGSPFLRIRFSLFWS